MEGIVRNHILSYDELEDKLRKFLNEDPSEDEDDDKPKKKKLKSKDKDLKKKKAKKYKSDI